MRPDRRRRLSVPSTAAVFDTAALVEGHLYQLDAHLARFLGSAARANIPLPAGLSVDQMRRTILETAAASLKLNGAGGRPRGRRAARAVHAAHDVHDVGGMWAARQGGTARPPTDRALSRRPLASLARASRPPSHAPAGHVRYWLSAGRGGFGLSGNECLGSAFYCVAYTQEEPEERLDGAPPPSICLLVCCLPAACRAACLHARCLPACRRRALLVRCCRAPSGRGSMSIPDPASPPDCSCRTHAARPPALQSTCAAGA